MKRGRKKIIVLFCIISMLVGMLPNSLNYYVKAEEIESVETAETEVVPADAGSAVSNETENISGGSSESQNEAEASESVDAPSENVSESEAATEETGQSETEQPVETEQASETESETEGSELPPATEVVEETETLTEEPVTEETFVEETETLEELTETEEAAVYTIQFDLKPANGGYVSVKGNRIDVNAFNNSNYEVEENEDFTFQVTALEGYELKSVKANGAAISKLDQVTYQVKEINADTTISIVFEEQYKTSFTFENAEVSIKVTADKAAKLPMNTVLKASKLAEGSAAYNEAVRLIESQKSELDGIAYVFYDVYFEVDGEEIEPEAGLVKVTMNFKSPIFEDVKDETDGYNIIHINEKNGGKVVEDVTDHVGTTSSGAVSSLGFTTDSFSVFGAVANKAPRVGGRSYELKDQITDVIIEIKDGSGNWMTAPNDHVYKRDEAVRITILYDMDQDWWSIEVGDSFHYDIPTFVGWVNDDSGFVKDGANLFAGNYTISKDGHIAIDFNADYLQDNNGQVKGGTVTFEGELKIVGGTSKDVILDFGSIDKSITIDPEVTLDNADMEITKGTVKDGVTITDDGKAIVTYEIVVMASRNNTVDMTDVVVTDTLTSSGVKYVSGSFRCNGGSVPGTMTVAGDGKSFNWKPGTMAPGKLYKLTYDVEVVFSNDNLSETGTKIVNSAEVTANELEDERKDTHDKILAALINIKKTGKVSSDGKKIDYVIKVEADKGNTFNVVNVKVEDVFGEGKEYVLSYTFADADVSDVTTNLTDKKFVWDIGDMEPGETRELTYSVEIDPAILIDGTNEDGSKSGGAISRNVKNEAKVTADNAGSSTAESSTEFKKNWIVKNGLFTIVDGIPVIKYTVQVNGAPAVDLTGQNAIFTDTLSDNAVYYGDLVVNCTNGVTKTITTIDGKRSFTYGDTEDTKMTGKYTYSFTYYARLDDDHAGQTFTISNTAGIEVGPGSGGQRIDHTASYSKVISHDVAVDKKRLGVGDDRTLVPWQSDIPVTVNAGDQYLDNLDKKQSLAGIADFIYDSIIVTLGSETLVEGVDYDLAYNLPGYDQKLFIITFKRTINGTYKTPIRIDYNTRIDNMKVEGTGLWIPNYCTVKIGGKTASDSASITYYPNNSIKKELWYGSSDEGLNYDPETNLITWSITINSTGTMEGTVYVKELLPDGVELIDIEMVPGGSYAFYGKPTPTFTYDKTDYGAYLTVNGLCPTYSPGGTETSGYHIKFKVITKVTDLSLLTTGSHDIVNKAEVVNADGTVLKDTSKTITITTDNLSKTHINGKASIQYSVLVNKDARDLVSGDKVAIIDDMGSSLSLDPNSIVVSKSTGVDSWTPITDYSVQMLNSDGSKFKILLPDNTFLKVEYTAIVSGQVGEIVDTVNKVYFEGSTTIVEDEEKQFQIQESGATSTSDTGIFITKRNMDLEVLPDAEFAVAPVNVDASGNVQFDGNGKPTLGSVVDNFVTDGSGKTFFGPLTENVVYCFVETKAPAGYILDSKPTYFVIAKGTDAKRDTTISSLEDKGFECKEFQNGDATTIYNKKGSVKVTKVFTGFEGVAIPDGEYKFGLFEVTGTDTYTLVGTPKSITVSGGAISGNNYVEFTELDSNKTYQIFELDSNNNRLDPDKGTGKLTIDLGGGTSMDITVSYSKGSFTVTSENPNQSVTVTNSNVPELIDISGTKTWDDDGNQDGKRPNSITVNLIKNGGSTPERSVTVTPDENGDWKYEFTDLPKYENGTEIKYTVTENAVDGYTSTVSGYNITNKYTPEAISISGTKTWDDNGNQDGKRPGSITVNLIKNGGATPEQSVIVTPDGNGDWKYSFTNLPKYENGLEIVYTVTEDVVSGYTPTITGNNITNTYKPETVSISGTKTWSDNNNQDGKRPTSITVNLIKNGGVTPVQSVVVTPDGNGDWNYSFTNLPKYENGLEIVYTVTEDAVSGYTPSITGNNITNTYTPETTSVSGTKTWSDNNNQDGKRPSSITANLIKNGGTTPYRSQTVTPDGNGDWNYSFTNLPKYENGVEIVYTVTENAVSGYTPNITGYNIINSHTPETINISGTKTWDDNNNQDNKRPASITVNLIKNNGTTPVQSVTVTPDGNGDWNYSFTNLPKYENGEEITYTVTEEEVTDYSVSITGYDITNSYTPEVVNVSGTKTWDDDADRDRKRPNSIIVNLIKNGGTTPYQTQTVVPDGNGDWKYAFTNLPKFDNGVLNVYTVTEAEVTDYDPTISGYNITNSYTPEVIDIAGTKTWDDDDDRDGKRPSSIVVNLIKNNEATPVESVTVAPDSNGDWKYEFTDLPKYEDGVEITYTVTEEEVTDYETTITGYNITNSYTPETINVAGTKTWDDNNNQDGKRPNSITVNLIKNGGSTPERSVTVTPDAKGDWKYEFTDLPKYEAGIEITYTVIEEEVTDYDPTITGYNITNSYTPETIGISGTKIWNDANNQDGKRPASITVNLIKNGGVTPEQTIIVTPDANGDWKYEFTNLPKYEAGVEITYTVTEEEVTAYETTINDYNITNSYTPETTKVEATKIWDDDDNRDGVRPDSIVINLFADGSKIGTKTVTAADSWKCEWTGLPKYRDQGVLIQYHVEEEAVSDYSATYNGNQITNTHTPGRTSRTVTKVWVDDNNRDGLRPSEIRVQLYADGTAQGSQITLNANNNWTYTWSNLLEKKDGKTINYTVEEVGTPNGYTVSYSGFTITNTHTSELTEVSGTKTWNDSNDADGIRPAGIVVRLYADGSEIASTVVSAATNWSYNFTKLPVYKEGKAIVYTITEDAVSGYTTSITGFDITNTHVPETPEDPGDPENPETPETPTTPTTPTTPDVPQLTEEGVLGAMRDMVGALQGVLGVRRGEEFDFGVLGDRRPMTGDEAAALTWFALIFAAGAVLTIRLIVKRKVQK